MSQPNTITMTSRQWAGFVIANLVYLWLAFYGYLSAVGIWAAQEPGWLYAHVGVLVLSKLTIWLPALAVLAGYALLLALFRLPWPVRIGMFALLALAIALLLL